MAEQKKEPLVRYLDEARPIDCPYGNVRRIVTGGAGGVANVHVVSVTKGSMHYHKAYDEVYYVLSGTGTIALNGQTYALRPGAAAVIPAGVPHELLANDGSVLEFIIFGTPAMDINDERAKPMKPA
ncbi:MAG TPA: cupin domain-containing protein [Planctomycetota bacterium]|nr:cupin domain-containing protein [Planctomycetota bacterium]